MRKRIQQSCSCQCCTVLVSVAATHGCAPAQASRSSDLFHKQGTDETRAIRNIKRTFTAYIRPHDTHTYLRRIPSILRIASIINSEHLLCRVSVQFEVCAMQQLKICKDRRDRVRRRLRARPFGYSRQCPKSRFRGSKVVDACAQLARAKSRMLPALHRTPQMKMVVKGVLHGI